MTNDLHPIPERVNPGSERLHGTVERLCGREGEELHLPEFRQRSSKPMNAPMIAAGMKRSAQRTRCMARSGGGLGAGAG
jgi:hypothetical protein